MIVPPTPVILVSVAVFAVLLAIDWYLGGMAYSPKPTRSQAEDSPMRGEAGSLRKGRLASATVRVGCSLSNSLVSKLSTASRC